MGALCPSGSNTAEDIPQGGLAKPRNKVEVSLKMGHPTHFIIENNDIEMLVSSWGASLMSLRYKMKEMTLNRPENCSSIAKLDEMDKHYGATCGRVAGRIANAKFTLANGVSVELEANNN
jgi:aldose 1-epimerase